MLQLNVNPNFKRSEVVPIPDVTTRAKTSKKFISEIELVSIDANIEILKKIDDFNTKEMKKPKTKLTQLVPYKFIYANYIMAYTLEENKLLIDSKFNVDFSIQTIKRIIHNMKLLCYGNKEDESKNFVLDSKMAKNAIYCPNRETGTIIEKNGVITVSNKQAISRAACIERQTQKYKEEREAAGKVVRNTKPRTEKNPNYGIRQMIDK